jgi:Arc/MetJ-type ribon-helix-helix transcriptional regulator
MRLGKTGVSVGSKVPVIIRNCIVEVVRKGQYISVSEFVRDAVKEKLQNIGYSWKVKSEFDDEQQ